MAPFSLTPWRSVSELYAEALEGTDDELLQKVTARLVHPATYGALKAAGMSTGRALDLGCGEGDNAIVLAQHGFAVTAIDFASAAIAKAQARAEAAGVKVEFLVDDLTKLRRAHGPFDLLVDYGSFDDLSQKQRAAYVREVVPLVDPGARFLLWCFEWELRPWERAATAMLPFGGMTVRPGEVQEWFGGAFDIRKIAGETGLRSWPRGWAAYLMTRL